MFLFTNQLYALSSPDPTRTIVLRDRFARSMTYRFNKISQAIKKKIIADNFLESVKYEPPKPPIKLDVLQDFEYRWAVRKQAQFMSWLNEMVEGEILETTTVPGIVGNAPWTNTYIQSAYQKGMIKARQDLKKAGAKIPTFGPTGDSISGVFNQPFHADRVGLIYSRVFSDLKGVTNAMSTQISRELALGMSQGLNPRKIARNLTDRVEKIGITRATLIARTEVVQSHNLAALNEYERTEAIIDEEVLVQWWTALDERVRSSHAERHGRVYHREDARQLLGEPNCRCTLLAYIPSIQKNPRVPEPSVGGKDRPMQAAKYFEPCFTTSQFIMANMLIANRPKECTDYTRDSKGNWKFQGKKISEKEVKRIDNMHLPPAWKNVVVSKDPLAKIQAIGQDVGGKWQYKYLKSATDASAVRKFNRVKSFSRDLSLVRKKIATGMTNKEVEAYLLSIEDKTCIRIGTEGVKARVKAYGLTTLQNRHVSVSGSTIKFDFIAKKGIRAKYEITDSTLAKWLKQQKKLHPGAKSYLFPDIDGNAVNDYLKAISGKKYTVKDFRTYHATALARKELLKYNTGEIYTAAQKRKIIKDVSTTVSEFLHNTPAMAKDSYISPQVWDIIDGANQVKVSSGKIGKGIALPKVKGIVWKKSSNLSTIKKQFADLGFVDIDTKGLDSANKTLNSLGEQLTAIVNKKTGLSTLISETESVNGLKLLDAWDLESIGHAGAVGLYDEAAKDIWIASTKNVSGGIGKLTIGRITVTSDNPVLTMMHELGHHVLNRSKVDYFDVVLSFENTSVGTIRKMLGKYATTNVGEFFSESFVVYTHPTYKVGMLPRDITKILDDLFGGK